MAAKDVLGGKYVPNPGRGTKVAEYIVTPIEKRCGTCEYLVKGTLCKQHRVLRDQQIETDTKTKLKIVDAKNGCCRYWEASESAEKEYSK